MRMKMKKNPWSLVWIKNSNWWKERNSIGTLLLFSLVFTGMGSFFLLEIGAIPCNCSLNNELQINYSFSQMKT